MTHRIYKIDLMVMWG